MNLSVLSRSILHATACVAYPIVNDVGFHLFRRFVGAPAARGVNIGITMETIFYLFVIVNVAMILISRRSIKLVMVGLLVATILAYLLPDFPLRGPGIAVMFGGLSLFAILFSERLQSVLERIARNKV